MMSSSVNPRKEQAIELWKRGTEHHLEGGLDRAIELYTKSIALYPTSEAYTFRGWAYSFRGQIKEAIAECERAIAVDPTFGNPYNDIGSYLMKLQRPDEAIEWFEKAKLAPRYEPRHFPYMNLSRLFASKGMLARAIEELDGALRECPGEAQCLAMRTSLRNMLN